MQEIEGLAQRDDEQTVGLCTARREFGDELGRCHPDGTAQPGLCPDPAAQLRSHLPRCAKEATRAGDVEKCFVDAERLDQGCDIAAQPHHDL